MAVGFSTIHFKIATPDATIPWLVPDERGWNHYTATIRVASLHDVDVLMSLCSTVTERPAIGMRGGGLAVIEGGSSGAKLLTIPTPLGGERIYSAILTDFSPVGHLLYDDVWICDATRLMLDRVV
jgi:hypothetical protein